MPNINCVISTSLKTIFDGYDFPHNIKLHYIDSNDEWKNSGYSLLVLNIDHYSLYTKERFRSEDKFEAVGYYDKNINRPDDLIEVATTLLEIIKSPGILNDEQITKLMLFKILIYDGNVDRVRGASYDVLLDKEHLKSGMKIINDEVTITVDPLDYVVVGAKESVNMPKNITGMFDLKVSMFCRGIILSNGPQIDPGYPGRLLCLLFNTSSKEFSMSQNQDYEFATVQFQALSKTTKKAYKGTWQRKQFVSDYIGKYADESVSASVMSIKKLKDDNIDLSFKQNELNVKFDDILKKLAGDKKITIGLTAIGVMIALASIAVNYLAILYAITLKNEHTEVVKGYNELKLIVDTINKSTKKPTNTKQITNTKTTKVLDCTDKQQNVIYNLNCNDNQSKK